MADQPHQSLYRRYRPRRFSEVVGQDHVTRALRNSIKDGRPGQGYLFSGPRGTGKTSTARILAQALNCTKLDEGEPCGICESCVQVRHGTSFDVHELDAASNNGVEAMRELVARAALGTPGRWKVYIVDEVHMLSTPASNALLKTLEEPPGHVVFVLATTDPQKVLPTIKSRVQHFEFHLLGPDTLGDLVRFVNDDAGLGLAPGDLDEVVRRGAGSARDALSNLDQVAALGGAELEVRVAEEVMEALCERDTGRALVAVAQGCAAGRDARRLAEEILEHLRNAFLATMARRLVALPEASVVAIEDQARRLGAAALVRAMERVGEALAEMRDALDPRVSLEVALVRVTAPEADTSNAGLAERVERLERRMAAGGSAEPAPVTVTPAPAPAGRPPPHPPAPSYRSPQPATPGGGDGGAEGAGAPAGERGALGAFRGGRGRQPAAEPPAARAAVAEPPAAPAAEPPAARAAVAQPTPPTPGAGSFPSRDALTKAWGDAVLGALTQRARARYKVGRFVSAEGGSAVFALPNAIHRDRCEECRPEVERAIAEHFGTGVKLQLVVETAGPPPEFPPDSTEESFHPDDLRDAPGLIAASPADRVKEVFPGAQEVEP